MPPRSRPGPKQARADAVHNRARILDATRAEITRRGPDAGMAAIAAAAGVAVGTLYRNFSTKADLVGAIVEERAEALVLGAEQAADRVVAGGDAWTELEGLLRAFTTSMTENAAIKIAVAELGVGNYAPLLSRASAALERILAVARDERVVRPDLTSQDLLLIVDLPASIAPAARERWLTIFLDGIAAGAVHPPPRAVTAAAARAGRRRAQPRGASPTH